MGDNDFPAILGGRPTPQGYLQSYVRGFNDYSQAGTDIPSRRFQDEYAQEGGGPLYNNTSISSTPSFDIMGPDIDSPEMDAWLRKIQSAPGHVPPKVDMNRLQRNMERLRREIQPILKGV